MTGRRPNRLRAALCLLAARIMYEEDIKQYFTAKRLAARRYLGRSGGKRLRHRPADLPSNGEIRDALLQLAELREGEGRLRRLFAMRVVALEALEALEGFSPRLIGSVSTGHIRRGSDIDIHVFCADEAPLLARLRQLGWTYELQRVSIRKGNEVRDYVHAHVEDVFPIELTLYDPRALRERPRSSTDGKPIVRLSAAGLRSRLRHEHATEWARYQDQGEFPDLEDLLGPEDGPTSPWLQPTGVEDDERP